MHAFGNTLHTIPDGGAGSGEIADQHPEYLLTRPVFSSTGWKRVYLARERNFRGSCPDNPKEPGCLSVAAP